MANKIIQMKDENGDKLYPFAPIEFIDASKQNIAGTTSWQNCSNLTIPANCWYILHAETGYQGSAPSGCKLSTNSNPSAYAYARTPVTTTIADGGQSHVQYMGYTANKSHTWYVHAKWSAAGTNWVSFYALIFKKPQ